VVLGHRFLAAFGAALAVSAPATFEARAQEEPQRCDITIRVSGGQSLLGGLELLVDYGTADGHFVGDQGAVECTGIAPGSYQAAKNDQTERELSLALISGQGVPLPQDSWRCTFETGGNTEPVPGQFVFSVVDSLDPEGQQIPVSGSVVDIDCDGDAVCGDGVIEGDEECDDAGPTLTCESDCELTPNTQRCEVGFRVTGALPIGGVQFDVDYSASQGEFEGAGQSVNCSETLEGALTVADDHDAESRLRLAMVSSASLSLPLDTFKCVFVTNAVALELPSFQFDNVIATDTELQSVAVDILTFTSTCVYGPYCGDGNTDPGETCDDGNLSSNDACTTECKPAVCGDGFTRTGVEQCDDGNSNAGDCCANGCTFESAATVCRPAGGVCDLAENCTGASGSCPADTKRASNVVCRGAVGECDVTENCNGTLATCPANATKAEGVVCSTDNNACTDDECNGAGACAHPANSAPCNDSLFCNGADTCNGGTCSMHAGNPCPGPDGDIDCSETCAESTDNCAANDTDGSLCNDGSSGTSPDTCQNGTCVGGTGPICGDANENGQIQTSDALRALQKSVGQPVACPSYVCDVNNNGSVQTSDAQAILRKSVGQPLVLNCPPKP
jgi:cysteine-rich repeat protein